MKRAGSLRIRIISFLVSLITIATFQPANAANLFTSLNSSCSSYGLNATWKGMQPFSIPAATTITAINVKTLSAQDPSKVVIRIYADNASAPSNTLLGSFTWISTSSDVGRYTGNVTLSSAGKYWIYFSASAQVYVCFTYTAVTTGSLSNWTLSRVFEGGVSATPTSRGDDGAFLFSLEGTGGAVQTNSTISLASSPSVVTYRSNSTLTATLGVAGSDGKVTFYANGKKIPGCIGKSSSSLTATCNWQSSTRGSVSITARLVPSDSGFLASLSSAKNLLVTNRTTRR
jgi:hypothetical protein